MTLDKTNTYMVDPENILEMRRLIHLAELFAQVLPDWETLVDFQTVYSVIDLACGPGQAIFDLAERYPQLSLVGVDISHQMIDYATTRAEAQRFEQVRFQVMNILEPLPFPDASFDLAHLRFFSGFVPTNQWKKVLREAVRILRPGGRLLLIDGDCIIHNSPAMYQIGVLFTSLMFARGQSFLAQGNSLGVTAFFSTWLEEVGLDHVRLIPSAIDTSKGKPLHEATIETWITACRLLAPSIIAHHQMAPEDFNALLEQARREGEQDEIDDSSERVRFCGTWYLLTAIGEKPLAVAQG